MELVRAIIQLLDDQIFDYELDVRTLTNAPDVRFAAVAKLKALRDFRDQVGDKLTTQEAK